MTDAINSSKSTLQNRANSVEFYRGPVQRDQKSPRFEALTLRATDISALPTELLGHVVSFLPPDDLLRTSHVSRHWRASASLPLQASCVRAGLDMPSSGVKRWSALQACALGAAKRWRIPFTEQPPAVHMPSPSGDKSSHCFPDGSLQVVQHGVFVNGKERMFFNLPPVGSENEVRVESLPSVAQESWGHLGCIGLTNSQGFILYSNTIRLFKHRSDMAPCFTAVPRAYSTCAAVSDNFLATGHCDGVRLWHLPSLNPRGYIATEKPIKNVGMFSNGTHLVASMMFSAGKTYVWDTETLKCNPAHRM